jgi:hypothetical protein
VSLAILRCTEFRRVGVDVVASIYRRIVRDVMRIRRRGRYVREVRGLYLTQLSTVFDAGVVSIRKVAVEPSIG